MAITAAGLTALEVQMIQGANLSQIKGQGRGEAPKPDKGQAQKDTAPLYELRRETLVQGSTPLKDELTGEITPMVEFNRNLHVRMVETLNVHLTRLLDLKNSQDGKAVFHRIMNAESNKAEVSLLDMVTTPDGRIDKEKLGNILQENGVVNDAKSGRGWQLAMTVLENNMTRQMYALGMAGALKHHGKDTSEGRQVLPEDLSLALEIDEGILHAAARKFKGVLIGGAVGGALGGVAAAAIPGSILALGPMGILFGSGGAVGISAIISGLRAGYKIDLKGFEDGLAIMQADTVESEYMARIYGIDPNNFVVDSTGKVQPRAPLKEFKTSNLRSKQQEVVDMMVLRMMTYKTWGVDLSALDAFPEQSFFTYPNTGADNAKAERTGAVHARLVDAKYFKLCQERGGVPAGTQAQIKIRQEARRMVMGDLVQELLKGQLEAAKKDTSTTPSSRRPLAGLAKQLELLGDPAKKDITSVKAAQIAESSLSDKKTYEAVKAILTAHETRRAAYDGAGVQIAALLEEAKNTYGTDGLPAILAEISRRERIDITVLQAKLEELRAAEQAMAEAEHASGQFAQQSVLFDKFVKDFGFDLNQLSTSNPEDILARINLLHNSAKGKGPKPGWKPEDNSNHRLEVIKVIAESRARLNQPQVGIHAELDIVLKISSPPSQFEVAKMTTEKLINAVGNVTISGVSRLMTIDEANSAIRQAQLGISERAKVWSDMAGFESTWREEHNRAIADRKARISADKVDLVAKRDAVLECEADIAKREDVSNIASNILLKAVYEYQDHLFTMGALAVKTAGQTYDISKAEGMTFEQVILKINEANKAGQGGWAETSNASEENITSVICYLAQSKAKSDQRYSIISAELNSILGQKVEDSSGNKLPLFSEIELITSPGQALINKLASVRQMNSSDYLELKNAITAAKSRHDLRTAYLTDVINEAIANGKASGASAIAKLGVNAGSHIMKLDPAYYKEYADRKKLRGDLQKEISARYGLPKVTMTEIDKLIKKLEIDEVAQGHYENIGEQVTAESVAIRSYAAAHAAMIAKRQECEGIVGHSIFDSKELEAEHGKLRAHPTDRLKAIRDALKAQQAKRELSSEDAVALVKTFETGKGQFEKITRSYEAILRAAVPPISDRLDEGTLATDPYKDIMRRINHVNQLNSAAGWPASENEAHKEEVVLAMLEARMRAENVNIIASNTDFDRLTARAIHLTEQQLILLSENEITNHINLVNHRNNAFGWSAADNVTNLAVVRSAVNEAKRRFGERARSFKSSADFLNDADGRLMAADREINRARESLAGDRFYVETVKDMAEQADRRLFPWVRAWAGPNGEARSTAVYMAVKAQDEEYTQAERFSVLPTSGSSGTERALPKGYYDMLNAMTGYQNLVGVERAKRFEALLNHPQFSPEGMFKNLNTMFNLGLTWAPNAASPVNLENVFVQIRIKLRGVSTLVPSQPPSLNAMLVHEAFEALQDDMLAKAEAL